MELLGRTPLRLTRSGKGVIRQLEQNVLVSGAAQVTEYCKH